MIYQSYQDGFYLIGHHKCTCLLLDVSEMLMQSFFKHLGSQNQLMKFRSSHDEFVPCRVRLAAAYFSSSGLVKLVR